MKKENQKRYAVPIIITLILLLYFIVYFGVLIAILPKDWKYVLFIFPLALAVIGLLIYVCIDRIKEIRTRNSKSCLQTDSFSFFEGKR